jgi:putative ABC transport system permease protein
MNRRPPRLASWLVRHGVAPHLVEALVGDLEELFALEAALSPRRARLAYWRRALDGVWRLRRRGRLGRPDLQGDSVMATFWRDLVHGLRLFGSQPSYSIAAVVTLALAFGANTLIFTMINALVLKPLPLADPDRLGWILTSGPNASQDRAGVSLPDYVAYRNAVPAFASLAAHRTVTSTLRRGSSIERVNNHVVAGDLIKVWGLRAAVGRVLTRTDEGPNAPPVVVLSHRYWDVRLGRPSDVVGQTVVLDGVPRTIVGILAPGFDLGNLAEIDLWSPLAVDPSLAPRTDRGWRPVGRLRDGATLADARAQVAAVSARLAAEFPDTNRDWTSRVASTRDAMAGADVWIVLGMLSAVVGLLLALACANIMNLLIARLIGRQRELAVRTALGASRGRVVRQIACESLVIGLAGGLAGLAIAAAGLRGVRAISSEPFFHQLRLEPSVYGFAALLAVVTPLLFSVVPALRLLRDDPRLALGDGSARSIGGGAAGRGRSALVVVQVSLAVTLLVVATLMVKSVRAALSADLGYSPAGLVTAEIDVPEWMRADEGEAQRLRSQVIDRVRALPGVERATLTTAVPGLTFPVTTPFDIVGRDVAARDRPSAGLVVVTSDYFAVTRVPIVAGRAFEPADEASADAVAVISVEAARRYWGGAAAALGASVRLARDNQRPEVQARVVGVSADTANADLDKALEPVLLVLDVHRPARRHYLLLRAVSAATVAPAIQQALAGAHPDLSAYQVRTVPDAFRQEMSSGRLIGWMFSAFAMVAVVLATAGLYGVLSFVVSQRTPEIAVRIALGAPASHITRAVLGQSTRLSAVGAALGLLGGFGLANAMRVVLYGVTPSDPTTYAGAAALALAAAVVASWVPMRRARGIDPIVSLRQA